MRPLLHYPHSWPAQGEGAQTCGETAGIAAAVAVAGWLAHVGAALLRARPRSYVAAASSTPWMRVCTLSCSH